VTNPYLIHGPALISFSGGRTSGFMLRQILDAHCGTLPDDVVVAFAITGKEREETLRFVHECETRWNVRVHWLERVDGTGRDRTPAERFREVGYNSVSRNGEPFADLIKRKGFLPNAVTRFCTQMLKIEVMRDFMRSQGWQKYTNAIGLRHDEGHRLLKMYARNDAGKDPWRTIAPMDQARVTVRDVRAFWDAQPFDLGLMPYEGNCTLCILKGRKVLEAIMREQPGEADWWIAQEATVRTNKPSGARFVTEYRYADLAEAARRQQVFDFLDDEEFDAECGLTCAA
jgi:3'-phosphoadenosine 5'-phosphosulfate sulfotransferase (PAPS reductase)/FAD synthetase